MYRHSIVTPRFSIALLLLAPPQPGFAMLILGGALLFYAPASLCSASALLITDLLRHCIVSLWTAMLYIAAAQLCLDPPCLRSSRIFFAFAMQFDTFPRLAEPLRSYAKPCSPNKLLSK